MRRRLDLAEEVLVAEGLERPGKQGLMLLPEAQLVDFVQRQLDLVEVVVAERLERPGMQGLMLLPAAQPVDFRPPRRAEEAKKILSAS